MYLKFEGVVIYSESLESINQIWIDSLVSFLQKFCLTEAGLTKGKLPFDTSFRVLPEESSIKLDDNSGYRVEGRFTMFASTGFIVDFVGKPDFTSSSINWRIDGFPHKEFKEALHYYNGKKKIKGDLFSLPDVHIEIELKKPLDSQQESLILELAKNFCKARGFYCSDEFLPNESLTKGLHLDYVAYPAEIESLIGELASSPKWKDKISAIILS